MPQFQPSSSITMSRPAKGQKTKELFHSIDSSPNGATTPAPPRATSQPVVQDDAAVSSDDEFEEIPSVLPHTPSRPHPSLSRSGRAVPETSRPATEPPAKRARIEPHPMMDDPEDELFIPRSLEHLNGALALPPRNKSAQPELAPFPISSSQQRGVQRKISHPFGVPQAESPGSESEEELEAGIASGNKDNLTAASVEPGQRNHKDGVAASEGGPEEAVLDHTQRTHITVQAELEESLQQTLRDQENAALSPNLPSSNRSSEPASLPREELANTVETDQSDQRPQQAVNVHNTHPETAEHQPAAGSATCQSAAPPVSSSRGPSEQSPPVSAQPLPCPARSSANPGTSNKRKRTRARPSNSALKSQAHTVALTALRQGSPVLGSGPVDGDFAPSNGPALTTPSNGSLQRQEDASPIPGEPGTLAFPDASAVLSYDASHFSSVTVSVLSEHLVDMTVLLGSEDWTNGGATWGSELVEEPRSVLAPYQSDICRRLGRYLVYMARICRDIPGNPGTQTQFEYFGSDGNRNKTLLPTYITSIDNQVSEIVQKKLGRHSTTPAKSRCRVALDLRRNLIPVGVLMLELVFLAGRPTGDAGLLDATPQEADHTKQTLQLLRRILSWVEKLEGAMTEEFAGAANRQQSVEVDIPPGMFERQGLNVLIAQFRGTLDEAYRAVNKEMGLVNKPTAEQRRHLARLAREEERLQEEFQREERQRAARKRAERQRAAQQAKEDARRRFMESVRKYTNDPRRAGGARAYREVADLPADEDGLNGYHHDGREPHRAAHPEATVNRAYPDEVFKKVLRALKYSQRPDVESIAEALHYHVEDVWEVVGLLKSAAEAQQRADGKRMPEGLRRSFAYLYR